MKKLMLSAAAIMCSILVFAQKNDRETIEGNGKTITREMPVSAFDVLSAKGVYELKLSQGSKESVKIEADENLQEYFEVKNEGNKLLISMKKIENKNWKVKNKMKVYVTFRNLKELDLGMVGSVKADEELNFSDLRLKNASVGNVDLKFTANKLDVVNSSVGNTNLSGKAQQAVVKTSSVGNFNAGDLVVQTMNIENTGVGSAEVNAEKDLKVKDSFLGKVKNRGSAAPRKMNKVRV